VLTSLVGRDWLGYEDIIDITGFSRTTVVDNLMKFKRLGFVEHMKEMRAQGAGTPSSYFRARYNSVDEIVEAVNKGPIVLEVMHIRGLRFDMVERRFIPIQFPDSIIEHARQMFLFVEVMHPGRVMIHGRIRGTRIVIHAPDLSKEDSSVIVRCGKLAEGGLSTRLPDISVLTRHLANFVRGLWKRKMGEDI